MADKTYYIFLPEPERVLAEALRAAYPEITGVDSGALLATRNPPQALRAKIVSALYGHIKGPDGQSILAGMTEEQKAALVRVEEMG